MRAPCPGSLALNVQPEMWPAVIPKFVARRHVAGHIRATDRDHRRAEPEPAPYGVLPAHAQVKSKHTRQVPHEQPAFGDDRVGEGLCAWVILADGERQRER